MFLIFGIFFGSVYWVIATISCSFWVLLLVFFSFPGCLLVGHLSFPQRTPSSTDIIHCPHSGQTSPVGSPEYVVLHFG